MIVGAIAGAAGTGMACAAFGMWLGSQDPDTDNRGLGGLIAAFFLFWVGVIVGGLAGFFLLPF